MRLRRFYPDVIDSAGYFWVHAGHRETAINHAIDVVRDSSKREMTLYENDPLMGLMCEPVGNWVVATLIQGAWLREYHEWEKATKAYFNAQYIRNEKGKVDWKGITSSVGAASHIEKVKYFLTQFSAVVPESIIGVLDEHRCLINAAKHSDEYFVPEKDFRGMVQAIKEFWTALMSHEEFLVWR